MILANFKDDFWELRSAEESHQANPEEFYLPPEDARKNLKVGDAAKLIFDMEFIDEEGDPFIQGERIFVIVSEIVDDHYIGILDSQPASFEPEDDVYLCFGSEIPFKAEHIIDIQRPPQEYIDWQLGQAPERKWEKR